MSGGTGAACDGHWKSLVLSPSLIGWVFYKVSQPNDECRAERKFFP